MHGAQGLNSLQIIPFIMILFRGPYLDNTDVLKVMDSVIGNSS